jgi:hypothetical protein
MTCLCGAATDGAWTAGVHHGARRCARVVTAFPSPSGDWRDDYERRTAGVMGCRLTGAERMGRTVPADAADLGPTEGLARLGKDRS